MFQPSCSASVVTFLLLGVACSTSNSGSSEIDFGEDPEMGGANGDGDQSSGSGGEPDSSDQPGSGGMDGAGGNVGSGAASMGGSSSGCHGVTCDENATCADEPNPGCVCDSGYEGDGEQCSDQDGCSGVTCFQDAGCVDAKPPETGYSCPPCPEGWIGDGEICLNGVILVDAAASSVGKPDGQTWETAFPRIQDAIDAAKAGDQIWVAQGVYRASKANEPVMVLAPGVSVYGGFPVGAQSFAERSLDSELTVLSGDVLNDDSGASNKSDNSAHVVLGSSVSEVVLDGVTVERGHASSTGGGGMRLADSEVQLEGLIFRENGTAAGLNGAALFNDSSSPVISNTVFMNNVAMNATATDGFGGAVYNAEGSGPQFTDVMFIHNEARQGGAVYNTGANASFERTIFLMNRGRWTGGAVQETDSSVTTFTDVNFVGNSASFAGSAVFHFSSSPAYRNVTVAHNALDGSSSATAAGGTINFTNKSAQLTNVAFVGNTSTVGPAAVQVHTDGEIALVNGSFVNNHSATNLSEARSAVNLRGGTGTLSFVNALFWNNLSNATIGGNVSVVDEGGVKLDASCVDDTKLAEEGSGNVALEANDDVIAFVSLSGEAFLHGNSPCVDLGDTAQAEKFEFLDWDRQTTQGNGALDQTPIDSARHYPRSRMSIASFPVTSTTASWDVQSAKECWFYDQQAGVLTPGNRNDSVMTSSVWASGTALGLICRDADGYYVAAVAVAP